MTNSIAGDARVKKGLNFEAQTQMGVTYIVKAFGTKVKEKLVPLILECGK